MGAHDDQVGPDLTSHDEDLRHGIAFARSILHVDRAIRAIVLAHFPPEGVVTDSFPRGVEDLDLRLSHGRRLLGGQGRFGDVEDDDAGLVLDGQRAGQAEGFPRVLREVGRE